MTKSERKKGPLLDKATVVLLTMTCGATGIHNFLVDQPESGIIKLLLNAMAAIFAVMFVFSENTMTYAGQEYALGRNGDLLVAACILVAIVVIWAFADAIHIATDTKEGKWK